MPLTNLEASLTAELAKAKSEFAALEAKSFPFKTVILIAVVAGLLGVIVGSVL